MKIRFVTETDESLLTAQKLAETARLLSFPVFFGPLGNENLVDNAIFFAKQVRVCPYFLKLNLLTFCTFYLQ